jgi:CcdB protein
MAASPSRSWRCGRPTTVARVEPPRWLDIVRPRGRGIRAPLVVILQHHIVAAQTAIAAPLLRHDGPPNLLLPRIEVDGLAYVADLLDLAALPYSTIGDTVGSALSEADAITDALDAIFRGHPVGLPSR